MFIADGTNDKIWMHDRMGELVGSIGSNGRMAGHQRDGVKRPRPHE